MHHKTTLSNGFSYNITLVSRDLKCQVTLNIIYKVLQTQTNTIVRNRMPNKSNEKCISFLHCISSFKGTSYEHLSGKAIRSYFFLSLLAFISADIIFQKYLKSHSEKNIFITNFPFLTNSLTPPTPISTPSHPHTHTDCTPIHSSNGQNLLSMLMFPQHEQSIWFLRYDYNYITVQKEGLDSIC